MKVAAIQSNYLPWKGYFDIIHSVDIFVFGDHVQYTNRDWRNRNKIKTPFGTKWITVPVRGGIHQKVSEVHINNTIRWMEKQKGQLETNYSHSPYFESYKSEIFGIFSRKFDLLSELNMFSIKKIAQLVGIQTQFLNSRDFIGNETKTEAIIKICNQLEADTYLSGPSAMHYIDSNKLLNANITLEYHDYGGYPEYPQLGGSFDHFVSIIDLIFNCGEKSPYYIWGWRNGE